MTMSLEYRQYLLIASGILLVCQMSMTMNVTAADDDGELFYSDSCHKLIKLVGDREPAYSDRIATIHQQCRLLSQHNKRLDIYDIKINGLRSVLKIVDRYFHKILNIQMAKPEAEQAIVDEELKVATKVIERLVEMVDFIITHPYQPLEYVNMYIATDRAALEAFYKLGNFWLEKNLALILDATKLAMCQTLHGFHAGLLSSDHVSKTVVDVWHYGNVAFQRSAMSLGLSPFAEAATKYLTEFGVSQWSREIELSSEYIINNDGIIINAVGHRENVRKLGLTLFCYGVPTGQVLYHVHGGAYILSISEDHAGPLRHFAKNMPGVTIICVSYRLAPEFKYPAPVQDTFDVLYELIANGNSEKVKNLLGWSPTKIVTSGESGGGSMLMGAVQVLKQVGIPLPSDIVLFYPAVDTSILGSGCSRAIYLIDGAVSAGVVFSGIGAYARGGSNDPNDTAWYRKSPQDVKQRVTEIEKETRADPILNPTIADWPTVGAGVKLHLLVGEFDPLLSGGMNFVKKWPTKVDFHIIPNMTHGFISYGPVTKEAMDLSVTALLSGFTNK